MNKILCVGIILVIAGCGNQTTKIKGDETTLGNKFSVSLMDDFEIIEYKIISDTLSIVSTSDFLYYPFNKYNDIKDLTNNYSFMENSVEYNDLHVPLYRFSFKKSYIKFVYDDQNRLFEIVAAKIFDDDIVLSNQIKIGISKSDFISFFADKIDFEEINNINVIEFISGLTGIWHYYTFNNNVLVSYEIDTDYMLNKD